MIPVQLIMIMEDPRPAINYCKRWSKDSLMKDLTRNIPDEYISGLWNIIKTSKFKEDPKPILNEMTLEMKRAQN